jgi:hypothetical protein
MEAFACHGVDEQACTNVKGSDRTIISRNLPGWKLQTNIISRTDQSILCQGPSEEKQLTKTDRTNRSVKPAVAEVNLETQTRPSLRLTRQGRWRASMEEKTLSERGSIDSAKQAMSKSCHDTGSLLPGSISIIALIQESALQTCAFPAPVYCLRSLAPCSFPCRSM